MGQNYAKTAFDYPEPGPPCGSIKTELISTSYLYCLAQHTAEWPEYYCLVDCRPLVAYKKSHIVGARHISEVMDTVHDSTNGVTVIIYDQKPASPNITAFLSKIDSSGSSPTTIYIHGDVFSRFQKMYPVSMSNFTRTEGEQPGPVELLPATARNPAVYMVHRNQFQHCKTTIAYLGCSTVINISSRRLFLKTTAIKLENVQFDNLNEPYDEAIASLAKYINSKPKGFRKGNILLIDETGYDYGTLLIGWYLFQNGCNLEKVCEHLCTKVGELDPWYLDVLRAWADNPN